jgi:DNA repair exonuclease SbcCD ATPase subunit
MDVKQFVDSRKLDLDEFNKEYTFLREQYSTALSAAILEQDPAKQQELIQQVIQANTAMAEAIREILSKLNQGQNSFDPQTIDKLTADLIQYQKDYAEIERTKDKVTTLKMIQATNLKKIDQAYMMYYVYLIALVGLVLVISYLVFSTALSSSFRTVTATLPQLPVPQ